MHIHMHTQTDTILYLTNLIFGTPHAQIHTDTCTHTDPDTIFTFCTLWYTFQRHLVYHRLTHAYTLIHAYIDTQMYSDIDTQQEIHRDLCMFVYIHKDIHTHTLMCTW